MEAVAATPERVCSCFKHPSVKIAICYCHSNAGFANKRLSTGPQTRGARALLHDVAGNVWRKRLKNFESVESSADSTTCSGGLGGIGAVDERSLTRRRRRVAIDGRLWGRLRGCREAQRWLVPTRLPWPPPVL
jgi:hypothetical protein